MGKYLRVTSLLAAIILLFTTYSFAASSVSQTVYQIAEGQYMLEMAVTAHTNGAVSNTATAIAIDGLVYLVETVPSSGATAPTNLYDLTLLNADGLDIMGGNLANRSSTLVQRASPLNYQAQSVMGKLTLTTSGDSVDGAKFKVRIFYFR